MASHDRPIDRPLDRPLERRAATRTAVVWEALRPVLDRLGPSGSVLDIGGGTGGFAVRIAESGHHVTVVDPSPDALAALARRADEAGVADRVTGQQGDLADVPDLVTSPADLVVCHGLLGLLDDPAAALDTLAGALADGGTLSLLVGQRHAAVLTRAMAGNFGQARRILDDASGQGERRFTAEELHTLLGEAGWRIDAIHGVRVFADLVPSTLLEIEPGAVEALLELEQAVAQRPEYFTLATQLHLLASR